jgi:hypothetical protein
VCLDSELNVDPDPSKVLDPSIDSDPSVDHDPDVDTDLSIDLYLCSLIGDHALFHSVR